MLRIVWHTSHTWGEAIQVSFIDSEWSSTSGSPTLSAAIQHHSPAAACAENMPSNHPCLRTRPWRPATAWVGSAQPYRHNISSNVVFYEAGFYKGFQLRYAFKVRNRRYTLAGLRLGPEGVVWEVQSAQKIFPQCLQWCCNRKQDELESN